MPVQLRVGLSDVASGSPSTRWVASLALFLLTEAATAISFLAVSDHAQPDAISSAATCLAALLTVGAALAYLASLRDAQDVQAVRRALLLFTGVAAFIEIALIADGHAAEVAAISGTNGYFASLCTLLPVLAPSAIVCSLDLASLVVARLVPRPRARPRKHGGADGTRFSAGIG